MPPPGAKMDKQELIAFVDPGVGTGLAIFSVDDESMVPSEVLYIATTVPEGALRMLEFSNPWITVFEEMPETRSLPTNVEKFYQNLADGLFGANQKRIRSRVSPSMWKPFAKANKWTVDRRTPHERDVLNMARWWFLTQHNIRIEDIKYEDSYLWKRT